MSTRFKGDLVVTVVIVRLGANNARFQSVQVYEIVYILRKITNFGEEKALRSRPVLEFVVNGQSRSPSFFVEFGRRNSVGISRIIRYENGCFSYRIIRDYPTESGCLKLTKS